MTDYFHEYLNEENAPLQSSQSQTVKPDEKRVLSENPLAETSSQSNYKGKRKTAVISAAGEN